MFFPKGGTEEPFPVSLSLWLLPPPPRIPVVTAPPSPTGGGGIPLRGHGHSQHVTSHSTRTDEWTAVPRAPWAAGDRLRGDGRAGDPWFKPATRIGSWAGPLVGRWCGRYLICRAPGEGPLQALPGAAPNPRPRCYASHTPPRPHPHRPALGSSVSH